MAVTQHFVSELECIQSKISSWDIYLSNFYHLFPVRDQMNSVEGRKEKFDCFWGRPNQLPEVVVGEPDY